MGSKRLNRRELLKSGATLAGGFTLGAAAPALAASRTRNDTMRHPADDQGRQGGQIAYGDRSKHVTSVRIPHGGRPSPDQLRAHVSCGDAASGFGRGDHAILAPLLRDDPWRLPPGHRSQGASPDDPRPGGPSADVHHGGLEAPPVRHPPSFHRVRREPIVAQGEDRSGNARHDELRRMDRRAPLDAAQGVRPERRRNLVRRRRARRK